MASQTLKFNVLSHLGTLTLLYTPFTCLSVKVARGWLGVCGAGTDTATPTLDPGIDRLHPDTATQPMKYTSVGLVSVLIPYNTLQHPSLCLPPGGYVGSPGLHIRAPDTL